MSLGAEFVGGVAEEPVPFFSQSRTFERLWPEISGRIHDVFDNGKFSHGEQVGELEAALAEYTGARRVVGVNSGTDALVLLLRALGLRSGDEVVVPAYSFIATGTAVVLAGGTPVFGDIDPDTYALDPAEIARVATPRTRLVMPAHLFCRMADVDGISEVARDLGLTVVEDSAEAIGMRHRGVHAGLHGAGGALSFFPTKTLGALGDAGAVLTDDDRLADIVAALRHHGRVGRTLNDFPAISTETALAGTNSKMDDIQAAILLAKLPHLDDDIARRAELAERYRAGLDGVVRLPDPGGAPVFYVQLIEVELRDELAEHLAERGIGTEIYYPAPLHLQPCFAAQGHRRGDFPRAEAASARALALPLHADLEPEQVDRVCATIREFCTGRP